MKYNFLIFLALTMIAFTSCSKDGDEDGIDHTEEVNDPKDHNEDGEKEDGEKNETIDDKDDYFDGKNDCFELVFPISYGFEDGTTVTGNDYKELKEKLRAWFSNNPDSEEKPLLVYPIEIIIDGKNLTIEKQEGLERVKKGCEEDKYQWDDEWEKHDCLELIYPVTFIMPDGTTISGDKEALKDALIEWYKANPEAEAKPELQFPVELKLGDRLMTANNEQELRRIREACKDDDDDDENDNDRENCIEFVFPISYTMPNGEVVSGGDAEELKANMALWYETNGDSDVKPELVFPIAITLDDEFIRVMSAQELNRWREHCDDNDDDEYDCPEIRADIGDDCRKDDGTAGTVSADCDCL